MYMYDANLLMVTNNCDNCIPPYSNIFLILKKIEVYRILVLFIKAVQILYNYDRIYCKFKNKPYVGSAIL